MPQALTFKLHIQTSHICLLLMWAIRDYIVSQHLCYLTLRICNKLLHLDNIPSLPQRTTFITNSWGYQEVWSTLKVKAIPCSLTELHETALRTKIIIVRDRIEIHSGDCIYPHSAHNLALSTIEYIHNLFTVSLYKRSFTSQKECMHVHMYETSEKTIRRLYVVSLYLSSSKESDFTAGPLYYYHLLNVELHLLYI